MADRNALLQEKAGVVKQQQEIIDAANAKIEAIREEASVAITPLAARLGAINTELLNDLDSEAGITHSNEVEACPA